MAGFIENSSGDAAFDAYAQGRAVGAAKLQNLSNFAQWSALMDDKTCDWCAWADLRIFDTTIEPYYPPMHHGCRCIVAYITNDEFPPNPDWGDGPPPSSWPPGITNGVDKSGKPTLPNEGQNYVYPEAVDDALMRSKADEWHEKFGDNLQEIGPGFDARGRVDFFNWKREMMEDVLGGDFDERAYDMSSKLFGDWVGGSSDEKRKMFEILMRGTADDLAAAISKQEVFKFVADEVLDVGFKGVSNMVRADAAFTREVMLRSSLVKDGKITLYRGMHKIGKVFDEMEGAFLKGDTGFAVGSGYIDSWTMSREFAENWSGSSKWVFVKEVPVDDLIASNWTQPGWQFVPQGEVIWQNELAKLVPKSAKRNGEGWTVEMW